ncbi:unnamed protein product [Urochloa humidicola]
MVLMGRRRSRRLSIGKLAEFVMPTTCGSISAVCCLLHAVISRWHASCTTAIIPQLRIQANHVGFQNLELKLCIHC